MNTDVLLWNISKWCRHDCSNQPEAPKWWFTWKHPGNGKVPCLIVNSLSVNSLLATICGKSTGDLYPENRREQVVEKMDVTFCSLAERWVSGCFPLPTCPPSSVLPAVSSHSDLLQPKAICQLSQVSYSYKEVQENKLERATSMWTPHLTGQHSLSLLFKAKWQTHLSNNLNLANYTNTSTNHSFCISLPVRYVLSNTSPITTFVSVGEQLCEHFTACCLFHKNE